MQNYEGVAGGGGYLTMGLHVAIGGQNGGGGAFDWVFWRGDGSSRAYPDEQDLQPLPPHFVVP